MLLLPRPYPDEIVGSVLIRARRSFALPLKSLLREIHGPATRRSTASFVLEANVPRLAELCGLPPRQLLYEHTVFPYIVAFLPWDYACRLEEKFLGAQAPRASSTASLVLNVTQGAPFRKFCLECAKSDQHIFGETYWHRVHQLPTAILCLQHCTPLRWTTIRPQISSLNSSLSLPPTQAPSRARSAFNQALAVTLTALSADVLTSCDGLRENWCERYQSSARTKGFVHPNGVLASAALADSLNAYFGDKLLSELKCQIDATRHKAWPALLLRPGCKEPTSVVRHLLMETFLVHGSISQNQKEALSVRTYTTRDYGKMDRKAAEVLKRTIKAAALKSSVLTVHQLLTTAEIRAPYVHSRERFPLCRQIIEEFKGSPQSARQLGGSEYWRSRAPSRWGLPSKRSPS